MTSTQQPTFDTIVGAALYRQSGGEVLMAIPPNPPTPEAIKRAQFVDKTYKWTGK
jgi:hypothetical protein